MLGSNGLNYDDQLDPNSTGLLARYRTPLRAGLPPTLGAPTVPTRGFTDESMTPDPRANRGGTAVGSLPLTRGLDTGLASSVQPQGDYSYRGIRGALSAPLARASYPNVGAAPNAEIPKPEPGPLATRVELGVRRPTPAMDRYEELLSKGEPRLHGVKEVLDVLGQGFVPAIEAAIPGTPGHYRSQLGRARLGAEEESSLGARQSQEDYQRFEENKPQTVESGGLAYESTPLGWAQIGTPKLAASKTPTDEEQTVEDLMTGNNGQPRINPATQKPYTRLEADQAVKQAGQGHRLTSPFEAYAYGSPQERQAAQDFIAFERQQGSRYERPGEVEQRYALYKRDPEAYKAIFGDRGAAQNSRDQAQATRMLNYFERSLRAIWKEHSAAARAQTTTGSSVRQRTTSCVRAKRPSAWRAVSSPILRDWPIRFAKWIPTSPTF